MNLTNQPILGDWWDETKGWRFA